MNSHADEWQRNVTEKAGELANELNVYLTTKDEGSAEKVVAHLAGLKAMYSRNRIPQVLLDLTRTLPHFRHNKNHTQTFVDLMRTSFQVAQLAQFAAVEPEPVSFDQIFNAYRQDNKLQELCTQLVAALRRVLHEADDELSAQVARELTTILGHLSQRHDKSLYDLGNWVDLGLRTLLQVSVTHAGEHGRDSLTKGIEVAFEIKQQLMDFYSAAQKRLIDENRLTFVEQAIIQIPEITAKKDMEKYLLPAASSAPAPALLGAAENKAQG